MLSRLDQLDIADLPAAEDEHFEYKSSRIPEKDLKEELSRAASGFWNSGGGVLVAGVDGEGHPDGGVPKQFGRTPIRDWVDHVLMNVMPSAGYSVRTFGNDSVVSGHIAADKCVLAVAFDESEQPPHMAKDNKYYIRAGAHTVPASHYVLDALWSKRRFRKPYIVHSMRTKPDVEDVIQLAVVALTDEPAVNVSLSLNPLPAMYRDSKAVFPLRIPLLDRSTPFYLDVTTWHMGMERLGDGVELELKYQDIAHNDYEYKAVLSIGGISPWRLGTPAREEMAKAIKAMDKSLGNVPKEIAGLQGELSKVRGELEVIRSLCHGWLNRSVSPLADRLSWEAKKVLRSATTCGVVRYAEYGDHLELVVGNVSLVENPCSNRDLAMWRAAVTELRDASLIRGVFRPSGSSMFYVTRLGFDTADRVGTRDDDALAV